MHRLAGSVSAAAQIMLVATGPGGFRIEGASADIEFGDTEQDGQRLPTFSMTAYTGVPMRLEGYRHPVIVDLASAKVPRQSVPVPLGHDRERIAGHTSSIEISQQRIRATGLLSAGNEHSANIARMAKNGFPWQASIGGDAETMDFVGKGESVKCNGRNWDGPILVARGSTIKEISFVPIGADGNTSTSIAAQLGRLTVDFSQWLTARGFDDAKLGESERTVLRAAFDAEQTLTPVPIARPIAAAAAPPPASTAGADFRAEMEKARKEMAAEIVRQNDVRLVCASDMSMQTEIEENGAKRKVNIVAHAIEHGWTREQTELAVLRASRPIVAGGLGYSATTPQTSEAVFEAAILQATRHQFQLGDDSFYHQPSPDGKGTVRRVPERLQREAQGQLKARYTDQVEQTAHTLYRGRIGMQQFLGDALRCAGVNAAFDMKSEHGVRSMLKSWDNMDIRAEGSSNLSISNILANVLNKFSLQGYLFTEQAWREVCGIRPVNDFKPTKSINLLGDVMFKQIGSSGELANASLGDQAFANQASNFGRIVTIPWQHIVNDDLGMLGSVPQKLGQGAGLALNDYIWALLASLVSGSAVGVIPAATNLNGDDGNAFFRTSNSTTVAAKRAGTAYLPNKDTAATLSATSLKSGKALFDNQIDPNGNPLGFDGSMPILLHGPSTWQAAQTLMQSPVLVAAGLASTSALSTTPSTNVWAGSMRPVMSRYIENANYVNSATAFFLLFNPAALAALEVCFLNGVDTPTVLQAGPDYQFDRLGISIRGTMPFGVSQQNFRAIVFNAGA